MLYSRQIRRLDGEVAAEITVPASARDHLLIFATKTVVENGGKIWENPVFQFDKNQILLTPVTFPTEAAQDKACQEIETVFTKFVESQKPVSVKSMPDGGVDIKLNIKFLFIQYQELMQKIKPVVDFVDNNGGWFDSKTNTFEGFDTLEKALDEGKLSEEEKKAFMEFGKFMGAYMIGLGQLDEEPTIVTH